MNIRKRRHSHLFIVFYGLLLLLLLVTASDCTRKKVNTEKKEFAFAVPVYTLSPDSFPFRFEISDQARFSARQVKEGVYYCDIKYSSLKAQLYCTWHRITPDRFPIMAEESHRLAYQHSAMATAIKEKMYSDEEKRVYGILYDIEGEVATPLQFSLTDSVHFFLNSSLYFETVPNADSLAPVIQYIRKDMVRIMESYVSSDKTIGQK